MQSCDTCDLRGACFRIGRMSERRIIFPHDAANGFTIYKDFSHFDTCDRRGACFRINRVSQRRIIFSHDTAYGFTIYKVFSHFDTCDRRGAFFRISLMPEQRIIFPHDIAKGFTYVCTRFLFSPVFTDGHMFSHGHELALPARFGEISMKV